MALYGIENAGYWLVVTYRVLFWTYFAATFMAAVGVRTSLRCPTATRAMGVTIVVPRRRSRRAGCTRADYGRLGGGVRFALP